MKTKMTAEQLAVKERLLKATKARLDPIFSDPDFQREHAVWEKEYRAEATLCKARTRAGLTQTAVAQSMRIPRANVSRIEKGQNITFATFTRYLNACGFDFDIRIFPLKSGASAPAAPSHRRRRAMVTT